MEIEGMEREPHHIVVITHNARHADVADPFLNAVGSGFVEWAEGIHIVVDFPIGERGKLHIGLDRK